MQLQSPDTLRALMVQQGISHAQMAHYSGCHKSFVDHLLSGRRRTCTPKLAERMSEALDVPLRVLFLPKTSRTDGESNKQKQRSAA